MGSFAGVRPVVHVPFGPGPGRPVLHDALERLVVEMTGHGLDGLVALGLASEAWTLTEAERDAVCETVIGAADGLPITVGIEGATQVAVDRARRAVDRGATGLMVLPPVGLLDPSAIMGHLQAVAEAAGVPVLVQDSPQITGVRLDVDMLVSLAGHPLVRSVKVEAPDSGAKVSALVAEGLEVSAGWGGMFYVESMMRGVSGCIPACDIGPAIGVIHRAFTEGRRDQARELYERILPLLSFEARSLTMFIAGAKRLLVRHGIFPGDTMRGASRPVDPVEEAILDELLDDLEGSGLPGVWHPASVRGRT